MRTLLVALAGAVLLSSCAGVQVKRVVSEDQSGLRYWRPAPYLAYVRTATDKGSSCELRAFYLPDKSEEYAITFTAGMGTAKVNPTLADGWNLTSLDSDVDSKTAENITAIASLVEKTAAAVAPSGTRGTGSGGTAGRAPERCEGVFRVTYDGLGHFAGLAPVSLGKL